MKKLLYTGGLVILLTVLISCSAGEILSRNYYVLEYYTHSELENLRQKESIPATVLVNDTRIPQTYNRRQIVIRHFGPMITYSDNDLWGVKLTEIIPNLISKRISNYNLFSQVQREFLKERPQYEINTAVNNIELYQSEYVFQAHLNIEFYLVKSGEESILVEHSVDFEKTLPDNSIETFVQRVNDMILSQTDVFTQKIMTYFSSGETPYEYLHDIEEIYDTTMVELFDEDLKDVGQGLLLLPALTRTDNEPYYLIVDKYGYEISGKMGEAIPLMAGIYTIHYGSGSNAQRIVRKNVEIVPRYKRIVEPDWGCLMIDVIDENRDFKNVRYEIFDAESGESYGSDFPAEEEVGEQQKVWVLKPGLYKVTINNKPFNTYKDFTTVYIESGNVQNLTIVVSTDEEGNPICLAGAGVLSESDLESSLENLKFSSTLHGNVNINSNNENDKDNPETTITLNAQLDNSLIYNLNPMHYTLKNLIEIGTSKSSDTDFRISSDEVDLKNTIIYYFIKNLGFYGRFDVNSHFFQERSYSTDNFYFTKIDKDGNIVEDGYDDEIIVKPSFFPLVLKEGIGVNYRILNLSRANLSIRAGFGLRQDFNHEVYQLTYTDSVEHRTYTELESEDKRGTEVSLVGNFQLPFGLTYSTNADLLFPFDKNYFTTIEWENSINLRIIKYISIDYKLNLENKKPEVGDEYLVTKHSLFLRVTYILR